MVIKLIMDTIEVGLVCQEGGRMNYSRPLLLKDGRKAAVACGIDIKILDTQSGQNVATVDIHKEKVVGLFLDDDGGVFSCDVSGRICRWTYSPGRIEHEKDFQFPLREKCEVENIAFVGDGGESVALVVLLEKNNRAVLFHNFGNAKNKQSSILIPKVVDGSNTFAFCPKRWWGAAITKCIPDPSFNIIPLSRHGMNRKKDTRKNKRIMTGVRQGTCVAIHPSQDTVAVGDHMGGIEVYQDVFGKQNTTRSRRLQWHVTPVADLIFSVTGAELFSGAGEGVVVQWHKSNSDHSQKSFVSRLGQEISHLNLSADNSTAIVSHTDNSFSVVDVHQNKLTSVILGQGIGCAKKGTNTPPPPPLLEMDNRTGAIVTRARPGHLHFYHIHSKQQLYLVDTLHENFTPLFATRQRDVVATSLSSDGLLMATVDILGTEESSQNLKFWSFDSKSQSWCLDTSILTPHFASVLGCLMQPLGKSTSRPQGDEAPLPLCLTWASDGQIKLWAAEHSNGMCKWSSLSSAKYQEGRAVGAGVWSACGNIVALSYGPNITLWTVRPLECKMVLAKEQIGTSDITSLRFCPLRPQLLISCSAGGVVAWCLLSRSVLYHAPLEGVRLQSDPHTGLMAVATAHNQIVLFRAEEGHPLQIIDTKAGAEALLFCPSKSPSLRHSVTRLLFLSQDKELMSIPIALDGCKEEEPSAGAEADSPVLSNFSHTMAESSASAGPMVSLFAFRQENAFAYNNLDVFMKEMAAFRCSEIVSFSSILSGNGAAKLPIK